MVAQKKLTGFFSRFSRLFTYILFTLFILAFITSSEAFAQQMKFSGGIGGGGGGGNAAPVTQSLEESIAATKCNGQTNVGQWMADPGGTICVDANGNPIGTNNSFPGALGYNIQGVTLGILGPQSTTPILGANGQPVRLVGFGAVQVTTGMMAQAYTNMPSSVEYVADIQNSLRNPLGAQTAHAQGLGFSSLAPVLGIWKLMRNLAYFFFVIIFLIIGFLIMFRSKIGGQAAVTVQQALPKLVVSLLLVTFSYAIAGLMIDVMYLIIYLMIGIFSASNVFSGGEVPGMGPIVDIALRNNIITNMMGLIGNAVGNIAGAVGNIAVGTLGLQQEWIGGWVVQNATNVIVTLVLAIFILVSIFRVFFALLQAYVSVFFSVIFAPIQLLIGAIPGQNTFGQWIGNLFDNLIVFPTVIFILLIAFYFSNPESRALTGNVMRGSMLASNTTVPHTNIMSGSLLESLPFADFGSKAEAAGFSAPQLGSNQGEAATTYMSLIALGAIGILPDVLKVAKGVRTGKLGVDVGSIGKNLQQGWNGAEVIPGLGFTKIGGRSLMPDRIANAVPFGFGEATPFRTTGKETGLERFLVGSRAQRQKEVDYQRQARLFGQDVPIRQGGLGGLLYNERGAKAAADRQVGGGASSGKKR